MKIDFKIPADAKYHQFCPKCHSENINRIFKQQQTYYKCANCKGVFPRLIVIDSKIKWWIDKNTKEYWHESVGVFVFNEYNEALFFERIIYPFALAIPAGHLDSGEMPKKAIKRELFEETGLEINNIKLFSEEDVVGDKCRRGADNHKWHLYITKIKKTNKIKLNDEGIKPIWLSLEKAQRNNLVYPVKYFINKYANTLCL
ncbi:NUDIX hydrolase [Desulfonauticus submarinus]